MTKVLVTGGAGFIGSNFVASRTRRAPRLASDDARQADLRGTAGEPDGRHRSIRATRSSRATSPMRRSPAPLVKASDIVVHFAAETHVDRSILNAGEFITTDVFGTFVLLEAARQAPNLRRFVQISTDEVYGSVPEGSSREDRRAAAAQSVLGEQGRRRSPRLQLLGDLRRAGRSSPARRTTTGRTSSPRRSSRSSSPTRSTTCRCRSTATGSTSATGCTSSDHCRARRSADPDGQRRRGLQHRRRQSGRERRSDPAHPRAARQAGIADPPRRGPPGARPPLLARHRQAASRSAGRRGSASTRALPKPSTGIARTSGGGGRSSTRTPRSRSTTRPSTAAASADRPCLRHSSPARPASPAAISSNTCSSPSRRSRHGRTRPGGDRRPSDPRIDLARRRPARRSPRSPAPSRRCGRPRSITAPASPSVGNSWSNPAPALRVNVIGTHHLLEAVRARRARRAASS